MAAGKDWNLTDDRLKKCFTMLNAQHTIGSIAAHYKIAPSTLSKKLKAAGVDVTAIRTSGKLALRAMAFESIHNINDTSKRVDMALKYLAQYKIKDETESTYEDDTAIDIKAQILSDLNG